MIVMNVEKDLQEITLLEAPKRDISAGTFAGMLKIEII
jgi:hypothetical protein